MTQPQNFPRIFPLLMVVLLAACGGSNAPVPADSVSAQGEALVRVGDISVRASPIQTAMLNPAVAQQYGIARAANTILLLVAVRQGSGASETSLPAQITASATDLRGHKQAIAMREVRTPDPTSNSGQTLIDYVGTLEATPPETLRFDIKVVRDGKAITTLQFNRDFYPQ